MKMTKQGAVVLMVTLAILGGILVAATGAIADARVREGLVTLQERYVPRMKLGPKLDAKLDQIARGMQDAVSAHDAETLAATHGAFDQLSEQLAESQSSLSATDAGAIRSSVRAFYAKGLDVSRRLMAGETGEPLLVAIQDMQDAEKRASDTIAAVTTVDPEALDLAFGEILAAQRYSIQMRLGIIIGFLAVIVMIGVFLVRHFRVEEQKNDAIMQGAWRELEALASRRVERAEHVDFSKVVSECASIVRSATPGRAWTVDIQPDVRVDAEVGLLRLLTEALLRNALRMVEGHATRVAFGQDMVAGELCCFVRDNGTWLDASLAKNVFASQTAFVGLRSKRPELATAQRVVRRLGGRIWAENVPGSGPTIFFTLPGPTNLSS